MAHNWTQGKTMMVELPLFDACYHQQDSYIIEV